jgi:hypothetical protein
MTEVEFDTREKIEVMQAFLDGETIEVLCFKEWTKAGTPIWDWKNQKYRVRPEIEIGQEVIVNDWSYSLTAKGKHANTFTHGYTKVTKATLIAKEDGLPGEEQKNNCAIFCKGNIIYTQLRFLEEA